MRHQGFTLIELMVVVAIIAILSTFALPTYQEHVVRTQVEEALQLAKGVKSSVEEYYRYHRRFPRDNAAAGVPRPAQLIGNFVSRIEVADGAVHITLGNRINALARDRVLTLRPAYVADSPATPLAWLCGYAEAVEGMQPQGENRTDVSLVFLSPGCRSWR